jgi:hypothetical protein
MNKPDWISENTLIETLNHPSKQVWLEEHYNQIDDERVFLVCELDTPPQAYGSFGEAFNVIGLKYGFNNQWKKV